MKIEEFKHLIEEHNIPDDCELLSDSGWECDSTTINGWIYLPLTNVLIGYQWTAKELLEEVMKADLRKNNGDSRWYWSLPVNLVGDVTDEKGKLIEQDIKVLV